MRLNHCALFNLRKTTRKLTQTYDAALKDSGLRITQFSLLAHLWGRGALPISTLAEEMVVDRTTLSRNLRPLAKQGLLDIRPGRDARVQEVSLTAAGEARVRATLPLWRMAQQHVVDQLGADVLARLLDDLETAREKPHLE